MRQVDALVLLGTVAHQASVVTAGSSPRGVGPEFVHFYDGKAVFPCIGHPAILIKSSQINDNSCDCPDGSDEPGTAACSYLNPLSPEQPLAQSVTGTTNTSNVLPGFWCANEGHVGTYVPFEYIDDGVCDYNLCCDGTDESRHVGGVKCENRCNAIGREWRQKEAERKASKDKAIKKRRGLVNEARNSRNQVVSKIASLEQEIKTLNTKRDELELKLLDVEREERGKVVKDDGLGGGKLGVLIGLAKNRVKELRDTLDEILDQRDDLQDKVGELESILKKFKEEYNPNFNDEGVKAAVKGWEDYAAKTADEPKSKIEDKDVLEILKEDGESNGVNWNEFMEEEASDADVLYNLEAYLPSFARDYLHGKVNTVRIWLIENGILADNPKKKGGESRLVGAARENYDAANNEVASKEKELAGEKEDLDKDYGPDGIFRALKGRCVSIDSGEYEYQHCWLDRTTQKSKKGHGDTAMGNFVRIDTETADDEDRADGKGLGRGPRTVLRYDNGQGCWNGPNRRTDVWLACAETDEIWRVVEAEKCVYKMEVGTPAACGDVGEPGVSTKDEL